MAGGDSRRQTTWRRLIRRVCGHAGCGAPPAEPLVAGEKLLGIATHLGRRRRSRASDRACLMTAQARLFTASTGASE